MSQVLPYAALQRDGAGPTSGTSVSRDDTGVLMATATQANSAALSGAASFRPFARVAQVFNTLRERARAVRELSAMSDAELQDIGLTRSDLPNLFDKR